MPNEGFLPVALSIVMDTYEAGRMKEMTQNVRRTTSKKIIIIDPDQAMPKSCDWATFQSNGDNKTELIQFIADYYKARNFLK